jgi:hypothetical protein
MDWLEGHYFIDAKEVQVALKIILQETVHGGFQNVLNCMTAEVC